MPFTVFQGIILRLSQTEIPLPKILQNFFRATIEVLMYSATALTLTKASA